VTALPVTILVVAKAPVPGLAKTRLASALGPEAAADIAAAALLDTLDAVAQAPVSARVVAMTGDLDVACRSPTGWPTLMRMPRKWPAHIRSCRSEWTPRRSPRS
jgi:hypothetical protein